MFERRVLMLASASAVAAATAAAAALGLFGTAVAVKAFYATCCPRTYWTTRHYTILGQTVSCRPTRENRVNIVT